MSAERDCFKLLDLLQERKVLFTEQYNKEAKVILKMALREFMDEHPEVEELRWDAGRVSGFNVQIGEGFYYHFGLEENKPQLAKCLQALETKFHSFQEVVHEQYGKKGISKLRREDAL